MISQRLTELPTLATVVNRLQFLLMIIRKGFQWSTNKEMTRSKHLKAICVVSKRCERSLIHTYIDRPTCNLRSEFFKCKFDLSHNSFKMIFKGFYCSLPQVTKMWLMFWNGYPSNILGRAVIDDEFPLLLLIQECLQTI